MCIYIYIYIVQPAGAQNLFVDYLLVYDLFVVYLLAYHLLVYGLFVD